MFICFFSGLVTGLIFLIIIYLKKCKQIIYLEKEKQLLQDKKNKVIELIQNLIGTIVEGEKPQELYQRIIHSAIQNSDALSACFFELGEDNILRGIVTAGLFPPQKALKKNNKLNNISNTRTKIIEDILQSESFQLGEGLIGNVAQTKQAILISNAKKDPRVVKHEESAFIIHSIIIAPILFRKNLLGVIAVANPKDAKSFNKNDLSLIESLAEQAGIAIHHANLMSLVIEQKKLDFDLCLASNIQGMLLPKYFPKNDSLEIDAFYKPAQKVGGDLYDVFFLSENKIGIAIADVSGKGIPASILMAICQTNLRHFAQAYSSPAEALKAMNQTMHSAIHQGMFITITYAIFDTIINNITLARAGHELPLIFKYDDKEDSYRVERIHSPGMALGMVSHEIFDNVIQDVFVSFNPQDTFMLYTDGITEATNNEDEEFGIKRLNQSLLSYLKTSAKNINQKVISALDEFTQRTKNIDDLTLVTVKYIKHS